MSYGLFYIWAVTNEYKHRVSINIEITQRVKAEDSETLEKGMRDFELSVFPDLPDESEDVKFHVFARNEQGDVIGGIKANVFWNGLEIEILWVASNHRRKGIASRLVQEAETFALENGAVVAYLKTVMAKEFYESVGYSVFGVLEDRPIGTLLYHMKKSLMARTDPVSPSHHGAGTG